MAKRNLNDARSWLKGSNVHFIGSHDWDGDEDTNKDSIKIVEELFEKGATKVEVDVGNAADDFACELAVTLPEGEEKARDILCYLGGLHADYVGITDGVAYAEWED